MESQRTTYLNRWIFHSHASYFSPLINMNHILYTYIVCILVSQVINMNNIFQWFFNPFGFADFVKIYYYSCRFFDYFAWFVCVNNIRWFFLYMWCEIYQATYGETPVQPISGLIVIVSPVRSTYGGYYGLVVVPPPPRPPPLRPPPPRPQTLHRSHDNLKNSYRIASIFYL